MKRSRFDPQGPGTPTDELYGVSKRDRSKPRRKRGKEARERRSAKKKAARMRVPLKEWLRRPE